MAERVAKRGQLLQALAFQTALLQPEFQIHARAELREAEQATHRPTAGRCSSHTRSPCCSNKK